MSQNRKFRNLGEKDWTTFRKNLKALMDSRGMNGKEFAEEVGLAPTTVTRYLTERTPDIIALWMISDACDVSIDWLVGHETSRYSVIPDDQKRLIKLYKVATPDDKKIIDMILAKYEK